jgi:hypothetical protein
MSPDANSAPSSEAQPQQQQLSQTPEAATETAGEQTAEEQLGSKAEQRIRQLISQRDEIKSVAEWYRDNVGTPETVIEFKKWKATQVANAEQAEESGQITEKQLKAVKALMSKADPELDAIKADLKQQAQDRADSMLSAAEDTIRDLCKGIGFDKKGDEDKISFIARQVSLVIRDDDSLFKMWRSGDIRCVQKAFKKVNEEFIEPIRGKPTSNQNLRQQAGEKRSVSKLPSLPAGSPSISQKNSQSREKGITKDSHNEAWDLLQSYAKG